MSIFKKKKFSKKELGSIMNKGINHMGFYSWRGVYDAYIEAGLSPREAEKATDARAKIHWTI